MCVSMVKVGKNKTRLIMVSTYPLPAHTATQSKIKKKKFVMQIKKKLQMSDN